MRKKRTALAVIRSDDFYDSICLSCKRFADRFDRVVNAQRARVFTANNYYNLILVEHPLEGLDNLTFFTSVRSAGSLCRNSPIISFSGDPAELSALKSLSGSLRESLPLDSTPYDIGQAAIRLLSMSVRSPIEILVQMIVKNDGKKLLLACQTKNLSSTGMLLRTASNLLEGSELDFSFNLPNDERIIQGTAKVVRRAFQKSERIEGMGVLFTNIDGDSSKAITDFVMNQSVLPKAPVVKKLRSRPPPDRELESPAPNKKISTKRRSGPFVEYY